LPTFGSPTIPQFKGMFLSISFSKISQLLLEHVSCSDKNSDHLRG
jgi:hypothetical protein